MNDRVQKFERAAQALGYDFGAEIRIGGHYVSLIQHGNIVEISGQIPRVGSEVVVTGRVGADVDLAQAQSAAKICLMRALALLNRHLNGSGTNPAAQCICAKCVGFYPAKRSGRRRIGSAVRDFWRAGCAYAYLCRCVPTAQKCCG